MSSTSQEKKRKVMYTMFTEWRHDFRSKMALLCLNCVECAGWRPDSGMKVCGLHAE